MKKRIITALFLVFCLLTSISFVACNKDSDNHTAQSGWFYDETNHWHQCSVKGHTDKLDLGTHVFGEVTTIQTGDDASSAKQLKICQDCGYEVYLELTNGLLMSITPSVTVGDETSVKAQLAAQFEKIAATVGEDHFSYREYVLDGNKEKVLFSELVSFDKLTIDFVGVDLSKEGYKEICANYKGVSCNFGILVTPDFTDVAKEEYTLKTEEKQKVTKYENGYLSISYTSGLNVVTCWESVDLDNGIISVYEKEDSKLLVVLDETDKTMDVFLAESLGTELTVYTIGSRGSTLNVYSKNGKSYCDIYIKRKGTSEYYRTVAVTFPDERTIAVSDLGIYVIGENNVLTPIENGYSYTGEFTKDGKTYKVEFKGEDKAYYVYLVGSDGEGNRTETLTKVVLYVAGKEEMTIYVISFEDGTVKRYTVGTLDIVIPEL